ncbi:MAG: pilus assembly protein PilM [Candidatus Paceibacterota bacterium]
MSVLETIDKWLPPPQSLRISGVGIDISESSIKYIGFKPSYKSADKLSLAHYGEVDLPEGVISRGEINDVVTLSKVLAEVRHKTGIPYARVSLPEERIYIFETEVDADSSSKEIRQQIEFKLEENVPLPSRDAYFDFELSSSLNEEGNRVASVTVCAKEIIDKYYEAYKLAKITPLSFEVESAAIARAVLPFNFTGSKLLIDFGKTRTGLGIVNNGALLHTSTIDLGGRDLSTTLKRQLGELSESELTKIKNDFGLVVQKDNKNLAESLLPTMAAIRDEVQLRIEYWSDKNGENRKIDQIIICGGSANLRGVTTYLSETLGIETSLGDVWQNVFDTKIKTPPIDRQHSYGYATAIGLGLTSFADSL